MEPFKVGLQFPSEQSECLRLFKIPYEKYDVDSASTYAVSVVRGEPQTRSPQYALVETDYDLDTKPDFYRINNNITIYCRISRRKPHASYDVLSPLYDESGSHVASITIDEKNHAICLPFMIDEVIRNYLFEQYLIPNKRTELLRKYYYRLKPYMPQHLLSSFRRGFFRRKFSELQDLKGFPSWPIETCLRDFYNYILKLLLIVSRNKVLPLLSFWPDSNDFCLTLTHDVDSAEGFENIFLLTALEKQYDFRSSFNIVAELYPIDFSVLNQLRTDGFEIGLHGLYHDGKLFDSPQIFYERARKIDEYAQKWHVVGFRSPITYRDYRYLRSLHVAYDSSYPDTDIYEPQPGGCCSLFPYFINGMVELPMTLPQDHTLFNILKQKDEQVWIDKITEIEKSNGLALMNTHSDYAHREEWRDHYMHVLMYLARKHNYWHALPCEVAAWWKRRDELEIVMRGGKMILSKVCDGLTIKHVELKNERLFFSASH